MTILYALPTGGNIILQLKDEMAYVAGLWGSPWRPSRSRACASFRGSFLKIFKRHSATRCALKASRALSKPKGASPSKGLLSKRSLPGQYQLEIRRIELEGAQLPHEAELNVSRFELESGKWAASDDQQSGPGNRTSANRGIQHRKCDTGAFKESAKR